MENPLAKAGFSGVPGGVLAYTDLAAVILRSRRRSRLRGPYRRDLAFPAGVEPTTFRLGGERSILLSYGNLSDAVLF